MIVLDPSQESALQMAMRERLSVITGGPGTGKTTILKELLARVPTDSVALCAPTGKAAKRMAEATGHHASTIHRLLGYVPCDPAEREAMGVGPHGFTYHAGNPLEHELVIVDEASMVDLSLFARLLEALKTYRTRLLIVGDANQLPSVGAGQVLTDLLATKRVPRVALNTVHRAAMESWVCRNAPCILAGKKPELTGCADFRFLEVEAVEDVADACADVWGQVDQILIPQRTGKAGVHAVNAHLQSKFNPLRQSEMAWSRKDFELRPRDPVIHTKNDYGLGVFNGEVGTIAHVEKAKTFVAFSDSPLATEYNREQALALQLAYALTIHKSQGSEWKGVGVVVHSSHAYMLTRRLVYTAITRARGAVVLIGNARGLRLALGNNRDEARNTMLVRRIREHMEAAA